MKKSHVNILIIIGVIGLIFLFPWFEIFLALLLLIFGLSYNHYWVHKPSYGPYLYYGTDPATSMVINWIGVDKKNQVQLESINAELSLEKEFHDENLIKLDNKTLKIETQMDQDRYYYHFRFKDLKPNTQYYYRIKINNITILSGKKYYFKTMIESNQDFRDTCIVYGDDQTADPFPILAQLTNHAQFKEHPRFMIHLGDINQDLWNLNQNNAFFMTKRKIFRNIPYMPAVGNHDVKPISQYNAFYDINPLWYSFQVGKNLLFIILSGADSLIPETSGQYEFLDLNLKKAQKENRFAIVCIHEGPYNIETNIPEERATAENRTYVVPLLKKYNKGFQRNIVLFSGHVHSYERIIKDEITFLTVGACSNAKYYSKLHNSDSHKYNPEIVSKEYGAQSFAVININNGDLIITIKNIFNKTIEKLSFHF